MTLLYGNYGLTSANQNITIYVEEDGIDQSECMERNESIPCHTLSYILNQINNDKFNGMNISVYVYIKFYQEITSSIHIQLPVNLYLIGVDNPVLNFSGIRFNFSHYGGGSFYAENVTFYKIWVSFYSIVTVSFNKCIFTSGDSALANIEGLYIEDIHKLTISNCLFCNSDAQSKLIWIDNVVNVEISGSEFYQNKGHIYLISIGNFEPVHNLTISNCLFHNNDPQLALIQIDNVFNVEISGSEFYQHKGQNHIISIISEQGNLIISNCLFRNNNPQLDIIMILAAFNVKISGCEFCQNKGQDELIVTFCCCCFFAMDNSSFYDNDIKDTIFHLESSNSVSMFIITNCLFSNNTSGGNILEITSDRLYMSNINLISNKIKWIEYSIIRITAILLSHEQSLHIYNINIVNNTGTGIKPKEVRVYFNNITFYNNTGVYGGGMSLYDTRIYLTEPLIFKRNTALFGGAIYITRAEIVNNPYNCTTTVFFYKNTTLFKQTTVSFYKNTTLFKKTTVSFYNNTSYPI